MEPSIKYTGIGVAYTKEIIQKLRSHGNKDSPYKEVNIPKNSLLSIFYYTSEYVCISYKLPSEIIDVGFINQKYLKFICPYCELDMPNDHLLYTLWKKEHEELCHPEIEIDTFKFKLLYKVIEKDYIFIKIRNTITNKDFVLYPSNSHCNMYRLCFNTEDHMFYKGDDYVTETFIHMDLQKFIYQNYNNLIIKDIAINILQIDGKYDFIYSKPLKDEKKTFKNYISVARKVILTDKFLNKISEHRCGDGFSHIYKIIMNILRIKSDKDVIDFLTVNGLNELFNILIVKIVKIWDIHPSLNIV